MKDTGLNNRSKKTMMVGLIMDYNFNVQIDAMMFSHLNFDVVCVSDIGVGFVDRYLEFSEDDYDDAF